MPAYPDQAGVELRQTVSVRRAVIVVGSGRRELGGTPEAMDSEDHLFGVDSIGGLLATGGVTPTQFETASRKP